jgi:hypothetical protein
METKQNLANLIDAYADAKKSGNEMLIKMAVTSLQDFLATHDVIPVAPPVVESPALED